MSDVHRFRMAMAKHLGKVITPEIAAEIEVAAFYEKCGVFSPPMLPPVALPAQPTSEQIQRLESLILQVEQVDTPTTHYFAPGAYVRQMFIPAGTVLTGAVHKTEHVAVFVGDITVWTAEHGMQRLTGHHTFVSKPGAKRVGYAHADTWCTGFFPSDKTDVAELERDLVENPEQLLCNRAQIKQENKPCLDYQQQGR